MPTTWQRTNYHSIRGIEITYHSSSDVPEPTRDTMALYCRAHRLGHNQSNARTIVASGITFPAKVNHDAGLRGTHPASNRHIELG